jgi:putative ABC transport system permease protein
MTLAFVLVTIAGLLLHSFIAMERADLGVDGTNLSWVEIGPLLGGRYAPDDAGRAFVSRFGDNLRSIPGVLSAAESASAPFGDEEYTGYRLSGEPAIVRGRFANVNVVESGYFRTLNVPVLRGRDFASADNRRGQPVAIVSRRFALRAFGSLDAVGRNVEIAMSANGSGKSRRIVGVVADIQHRFSRPPVGEVYVPLGQIVQIGGFAVRTRAPMPHLAQAVAAALHRLDVGLPPPAVRTFASLRAFDAFPSYMTAVILTTVAAVALILALSGIYGVVSTVVARRTREFGIRMALGAPPQSIALTAARETIGLAAIAIAAGFVLSAFCTKMLAGILFETSPLDAGTYIAVTALIFACSLLACIFPSLKAARSDPAQALRYE